MKDSNNKLLIAAITPSLLEKGADLFAQKNQIEEALRDNPWLKRNILIIEVGQKISLSEFLRHIAELGYTKVWETRHRGEFSQRGGTIHLFPINTDVPWAIEFEGNYISDLLKSGETKSLSESAAEPATTTLAKSQMAGGREKKQFPRGLRREENKGSGVNIAVLHGRMKDEAITQTMHDFRAPASSDGARGKIDILVSTTIIENGLDISEANTLIVEDATKLGLAQAHQLRGRIGRGDKEAFSYFLYPNHKLSEKAAERLEALERYSWLGAGIEIAKRDLELRGCGNILGRAQSGVAYKVGLNLYFQMLEDAAQELKSTK